MIEVDKQIEINVLRVSPDGKLIEFILTCPDDYHFTDFVINVDLSEDYYSIKDSIFTEDCANVEGAFEVSAVGGAPGKIYHVTISAEIDDDKRVDGLIYDPIIQEAWISDVSGVYKCLIDDIISFGSNCNDTSVLDRVIRNYLLLYAHQEALKLVYLDEARNWYNKLSHCFTNCGNPDKRNFNLGCGCSSQVYSLQKPTHSLGCGCGK